MSCARRAEEDDLIHSVVVEFDAMPLPSPREPAQALAAFNAELHAVRRFALVDRHRASLRFSAVGRNVPNGHLEDADYIKVLSRCR